jgi:hypothetical protein
MKLSEKNLRNLIREVLLSEKISMDILRNVDPLAYLLGSDWGDDYEDDEESESYIDFSPSSYVDSDHANRATELSQATGIKPSVIYAIEKKESAHRPSAFAFNPRLYRKYADDNTFYPGVKSVYGKEAQKSFKEAYALNPSAAIMAGAWGLYQVLGATSLELYGNDPEGFLAAFKADPVGHSKKSFIAWVEKRGQNFVDLANNNQHTSWVSMYYGAPKSGYINDVKKFQSEWESGTV